MNQKHIEDITVPHRYFLWNERVSVYCWTLFLLLDQEGVDDVKYTYLYHLIARKNQSTADRVERDMRYAFSRRGKRIPAAISWSTTLEW